jgi:hypothetical protein
MDISLMWLLAGLLAGLILFACVVLILVAAWLVTTRWVTPPWLTAPGRRTQAATHREGVTASTIRPFQENGNPTAKRLRITSMRYGGWKGGGRAHGYGP